MSTKQQKSISIVELKKPVISLQRPIPSPKQNEVLIKVSAAHRTSLTPSILFSKLILP